MRDSYTGDNSLTRAVFETDFEIETMASAQAFLTPQISSFVS